ncbi:MAG: bifunctional phosphoribosylaminoimidazolecarboxamide formyltransferase/IMP cyclohydrolase [Sphingomonadales bacterium]
MTKENHQSDGLRPVARALVSVSDKTGIVDLGRLLARQGIEILSTGGSARMLAEAGIPVREVSDYTGFPETMDGRVKTLHPKVHGGLLAVRDNPGHVKAMDDLGISRIDLLVVNLYPFEQTVKRGAGLNECIENIDIGGPAMIRSAAKNHADVIVITDPADYAALEAELNEQGGATTIGLRRRLAAKAFTRTAAYDAAISNWFQSQRAEDLPETLVIAGARSQTLRYGENPHQKAAFYTSGDDRPGIATAEQIQGKALSYNNIGDCDAAFELISEFAPSDGPAVAIIKHANPSGVARGSTLAGCYRKALACDPVSAFGGIVALNSPIDAETAGEIAKIFTEVVIAPDADPAAREILATKKNLRLLLTGRLADPRDSGLVFRSVAGGLLVQGRDAAVMPTDALEIVTKRNPGEQEMADMLLAFTVCKHVKSNAIIYVRDGATVGIGAGQMSRVDSARVAAQKARDAADAAGMDRPLTEGSVVASDAFFPFADGLLAAAEAGATAVIQPGGSIRDDEIIAAADEAGLAMVFTGMRHFRH